MSATVALTERPGIRRGPSRRVRAWAIPVVTLAILALLMAMALLADFAAPYSPTETALSSRLRPPFSDGHLLGTDGLGRDILSRVIHGSRVSLIVAAISILVGGSLGTGLGVVSAYYGGRIDAIIMRVADVLLGFPLIILAILLAGIYGPSLNNVLVILALAQWPRFTRMARGEALALKERDYILAARIVGMPAWQIIWLHLLPHLFSSLLILASLSAASAVIIEAALSFFGAGVPPPAPTWGGMINDGRDFVTTAWWVSFFPGLALVLMVLSLNLLGDWLRDEFDPRLTQAG